MTRALSVWWDDRVVGTLKLTPTGSMTFAYAPQWLADPLQPALSISLPKREQRFSQRECRPFFAGLLPEDEQLEAVAATLGISKTNNFALLDALGGDVAGALTLWPADQQRPTQSRHQPRPLDEPAMADLLKRLPKSPLLADRKELRLSLAGAQPKIPVVLVDGVVALPEQGQPTTHVVKPGIARFNATTENEALVMRLAAAIGLDVAPVEARTALGQPYLLVTRYDRHLGDTGVRRLHQEDFCQAMGVPPEHKYEAEGGPTFAMSFDLLRAACTKPAIEVLKLLDAAIFNLAVGNSDAHGKNFSLLYIDGEIRLAPLYDLLSTAAYPELSPRLAMKIGKRGELSEMGVKTWPNFSATSGLGAPFVLRRVKEITTAIESSVDSVAASLPPGLDRQALSDYAGRIQARAKRVRQTAQAGVRNHSR